MMYSKVKALRLKQNGWHFATKNCMFECLFSEILFVFWFKMHFKWWFITVKDNWTSDNYSRNASIFSLPCLLFDQLVPCGHVNKMLWKICIIGPWSKLIHLSVHTEFQYSYVMLCASLLQPMVLCNYCKSHCATLPFAFIWPLWNTSIYMAGLVDCSIVPTLRGP